MRPTHSPGGAKSRVPTIKPNRVEAKTGPKDSGDGFAMHGAGLLFLCLCMWRRVCISDGVNLGYNKNPVKWDLVKIPQCKNFYFAGCLSYQPALERAW